MIKMIVVDLDGTILNKDRKSTKVTNEYLMKLKNDGYIITIATGRPYDSVLLVTDGANFANYIINNTGACLQDLDNNKNIFRNFIDKKRLNSIIKKYNNKMELKYIYTEKKAYSKHNLFGIRNITQAVFLPRDNYDIDSIYNELEKELKDLNIIIMQDSFATYKWIEIQPKNSSKWDSICYLANMLNIKTSEIMAFGDGLNDLEMIQNCGYGVALKNALKEVKEVSKDITKYDNNNDGVIKYLKEHL